MELNNDAFIQEARELLTEIEEVLLEMEETPDDSDLINRLFRAFHTLKGGGGMFGFDTITEVTHHIETVLDSVRAGDLSITKELISLSLSIHDALKDILSQGEEAELTQRDRDLIAQCEAMTTITEEASQPAATTEGESEPEEAAEYLTYRIRFAPHESLFESGTHPELLLDELRELGDGAVTARGNNLPALSQMHPEKCYLSWDIVLSTQADINAIEDVFIFVIDDCDLTIEVIDEPEIEGEEQYKKVGEILVERGDITKEKLEEGLAKTSRIGQILVDNKLVEPDALESALHEQQQVRKVREKKSTDQVAASIRVPSIKLDRLVDLVGELVTNQARLNELAAELNLPELQLLAEESENLVSDLRDETMSIRMVPIGSTFSGFKRLVRELSGNLGKPIRLATSGEETELDKTVIDKLKDPLVHIIRNSADHGIETPEERQKAGKTEDGTIYISAEHSGAHVIISIQDDGAGLDLNRIREKSIENGLISADAQLSNKEISQLIFAPGFSTASEVSSISGRGVGMDVVKQNIESLRGSIEVSSEAGQGTSIRLKLPLTLAIIDGLMVSLQEEYYILPLSSVEECVDFSSSVDNHVDGRHLINLRGAAVPFIDLRHHLKITGDRPPLEQVVITQFEDKKIGLVVDEVIGSRQTVIKPLGPLMKRSEDVSGATILGDGTVALILDIQKLVQHQF